jgi:hypothetical protein
MDETEMLSSEEKKKANVGEATGMYSEATQFEYQSNTSIATVFL